jgi:hypothetical protein
VGEQRGRYEDHGAHAAVRGAGVHGDAEPVAGGEDADDGEAELGRVVEARDVHRAAAGQQRGGVLGPATVHADARVVDDHDGAVVHRLDADLDRGVGLRVARGVVQEFGDGEDDRFDGPALDGDVGLSVDADAPVVTDAGGRAADHLDER